MSGVARRLRVDGARWSRALSGGWGGRLSIERLRVVARTMRERRAFLDRGAAALWPSYAALRDTSASSCALTPPLRHAGSEAWTSASDTGRGLRQRRRVSWTAAGRPRASVARRGRGAKGYRGAAGTGVRRHCERLAAKESWSDERRGPPQPVGLHRDAVGSRWTAEAVVRLVGAARSSSALAWQHHGLPGGAWESAWPCSTTWIAGGRGAGDACARGRARGQAMVTTAHPGGPPTGSLARVFGWRRARPRRLSAQQTGTMTTTRSEAERGGRVRRRAIRVPRAWSGERPAAMYHRCHG